MTPSKPTNIHPVPHLETLDEEMVQILANKSGAERLAIAAGLLRSARRMLASHLRSRHPDWPPSKVESEVASRLSHGTG